MIFVEYASFRYWKLDKQKRLKGLTIEEKCVFLDGCLELIEYQINCTNLLVKKTKKEYTKIYEETVADLEARKSFILNLKNEIHGW